MSGSSNNGNNVNSSNGNNVNSSNSGSNNSCDSSGVDVNNTTNTADTPNTDTTTNTADTPNTDTTTTSTADTTTDTPNTDTTDTTIYGIKGYDGLYIVTNAIPIWLQLELTHYALGMYVYIV